MFSRDWEHVGAESFFLGVFHGDQSRRLLQSWVSPRGPRQPGTRQTCRTQQHRRQRHIQGSGLESFPESGRAEGGGGRAPHPSLHPPSSQDPQGRPPSQSARRHVPQGPPRGLGSRHTSACGVGASLQAQPHACHPLPLPQGQGESPLGGNDVQGHIISPLVLFMQYLFFF